jgi:hypothetical protein
LRADILLFINQIKMSFLKGDLQYHYSWTVLPGDNPKISGVPDSTLFNRNEGYEVVYLISTLMTRYNLNIASGQKIERMIKTGLPGDIRGQKNVYDWIVINWKNY